MVRSWANLGADLHLDVAGPRLRAALELALREAVLSGRLPPGTPLPPSRSLAGDLAIARNTVADAYAQLVAEGWLVARQGSGTWVADRVEVEPVARAARGSGRGSGRSGQAEIRYDLRPGSPDVSGFPRTAWATATREVLATAPHVVLGYPDLRGVASVRATVAAYLARARGVRATADRVIICGGYVDGLGLVARALAQQGARAMAVEAFGIDDHHALVRAAGLRVRPIGVDQHGARTDELWRRAVDAVALTPAHQFPIGVPLAPDRRTSVLAWARETGGVVVEDDYDGEFRYDRQPVGALQALDPERVVYAGTVSKSLAPAVRLGWLVLPRHLVEQVLEERRATGSGPGVIDQLVVAQLLDSGAYDRHVRRSRLRYRRRRDRLVAAVTARAPGVDVTGIAAGLHVLVELPGGVAEEQVIAAALARGLALTGLATFSQAGRSVDRAALVVGYGTPPEHAFAGAIDLLGDVLAELPGSAR